MKIAKVTVRNFRGILAGEVNLDGHTVLVGDNNVGKSTLLEAIDLVLGPERASRRPVVDEHDFYGGNYYDDLIDDVTAIRSEVVVTDLNQEQLRHFRDHLEFWNSEVKGMVAPPANAADATVQPALRVFFNGWYDRELAELAFERLSRLPGIRLLHPHLPAQHLRRYRGAYPAHQYTHAVLRQVAPKAQQQFAAGDYTASLQTLAALRASVDAFFEQVMVNAEDPALRANRLGLLATLHEAMNRVADLARLAV